MPNNYWLNGGTWEDPRFQQMAKTKGPVSVTAPRSEIPKQTPRLDRIVEGARLSDKPVPTYDPPPTLPPVMIPDP